MFLLGRGRLNVCVNVRDGDDSWCEITAGSLSKSILLKRSMDRIDGFGGESEFWNVFSNRFGDARICNSTLGGCCGVSSFGCNVRNEWGLFNDKDSSRASALSDRFDSKIFTN